MNIFNHKSGKKLTPIQRMFSFAAIMFIIISFGIMSSCVEPNDNDIHLELSKYKGGQIVQKSVGNHYAFYISKDGKKPKVIWVYEIVYNQYYVGDTIR
jgi:hypothetical protein